MENKHLKYFKVENFKCFDSFEMDNIGQFNLIVGDNNVGKTSVLEALLFREDLSQTISSFIYAIANRNQTKESRDYFNFEKSVGYIIIDSTLTVNDPPPFTSDAFLTAIQSGSALNLSKADLAASGDSCVKK